MIHPPATPAYSNKRFGWTLAGICAFLCLVYALKHALVREEVWGAMSIAFAVVTLFKPEWLTGLKQWWFKAGVVMGKITNPVVMGAVFFLLITPVAVISRALGRDTLLIKRQQKDSYWVDRTAERTAADSFHHQF